MRASGRGLQAPLHPPVRTRATFQTHRTTSEAGQVGRDRLL